MAHHETNHSTTLALSLVMVFLLAIALAMLFRATGQPVESGEYTLGVAKLEISIPRLTQERSAVTPARPTPAETDAFFARVKEINRLQFGQQGEKALEDASILLMESVNELAVVQGSYNHILTTSAPLVHDCQNAIEPVLAALRAKSLTWTEATLDPPKAFDTYRKDCGNVLPVMASLQVVREDGSWTDPKNGPPLFSILNRLRIASLVHDRIPSVQQLTPYEREVLYAWRFGNPALSLEDKVRFAESAAFDIPKFPKDEWLGRIYYDAGKLREANEAYGRACAERKTDATLQKKCRELQGKLAAKQGPAENQ